jgi:hypothetical protein
MTGMNTRRPWLLTHGIAFEKDDGAGGSGGTGSAGGAAPKTLQQLLTEHPHIAGEIDARTQRIAATEKKQGADHGLREFAKSLGVEDPQIIAETFRRHQEQQAAQMTEAERVKADAEKAKAEAAQALTEAKQARLDAVAIKHLSKAGAEARGPVSRAGTVRRRPGLRRGRDREGGRGDEEGHARVVRAEGDRDPRGCGEPGHAAGWDTAGWEDGHRQGGFRGGRAAGAAAESAW